MKYEFDTLKDEIMPIINYIQDSDKAKEVARSIRDAHKLQMNMNVDDSQQGTQYITLRLTNKKLGGYQEKTLIWVDCPIDDDSIKHRVVLVSADRQEFIMDACAAHHVTVINRKVKRVRVYRLYSIKEFNGENLLRFSPETFVKLKVDPFSPEHNLLIPHLDKIHHDIKNYLENFPDKEDYDVIGGIMSYLDFIERKIENGKRDKD